MKKTTRNNRASRHAELIRDYLELVRQEVTPFPARSDLGFVLYDGVLSGSHLNAAKRQAG